MAASGALRERKPESVQFWLAIAAVSFLFHALLLVGIKRWATMAVVEPDGGAIAVELVEPAGSESVDAPIVQAAALKPEVKPDVQPKPDPEIKTPVEPEPEPQVRPIVQPSVQPKIEKKQPAIASTPKPDRSIVPPKKNTQSGQSGSSGPKKDPTQGNQNSSPSKPISPVKSDDPLGNPGSGVGGSNLATSLSPPVLQSEWSLTPEAPGGIGGSGTAKLKLNFPTSIPFPATFALKRGEVIRVKVTLRVAGNDIQSPGFKILQPKLSGRDQEALVEFIYEVLPKISVAEIVIDNHTNSETNNKPDTDWETTMELRL